jgi:hypothetical protein
MRPLAVYACLVATTVLAADLKDPATVAREWNDTIQQPLPSPVSPTLSGQVAALAPPAPQAPLTFDVEQRPAPPSRRSDIPRLHPGPRYDLPSRPPIRRQPPEIPESAIPWLYRDQTYWLVPLGGPAD